MPLTGPETLPVTAMPVGIFNPEQGGVHDRPEVVYSPMLLDA